MNQPLREWIEEHNEEALLMGPEFDCAIAGVAERCSQPTLVVYDVDRCVAVLVAQGLTEDDAAEFVGFNQIGAWVGENTPLWLHRWPEEAV